MNLIFDMSNAFHKSFFMYQKIYPELEAINEKLLFNKFLIDFFSSIRLFSDRVNVDRIVCCFDDQENFRKKIYPFYKLSRTKKEESFYNVLNYAYEFLEKQGFICTKIKGLEGDDGIAFWINRLISEDNCILSADEDVVQLINDRTFVFNNNSKNRQFRTTLNYGFKQELIDLLKEDIICDPNFIFFKKLILGCKGDEVPKLLKARIGEVKLKKFYDSYSSTEGFIPFDKDTISVEKLDHLKNELNKSFKDQITLADLHLNLRLIQLGMVRFYNLKEYERIDKHILEKINTFKYSGNYQVL